MVAYNAQHTINWVLGRVPPSLTKEFDAEILVIDDQSEDDTFEESEVFAASCKSEFRITVLFNPKIRVMAAIRKLAIITQLKITLILLP